MTSVLLAALVLLASIPFAFPTQAAAGEGRILALYDATPGGARELVAIDPTTGATTTIATFPNLRNVYLGHGDYDPATDRYFFVGQNVDLSYHIYTVEVATGASSQADFDLPDGDGFFLFRYDPTTALLWGQTSSEGVVAVGVDPTTGESVLSLTSFFYSRTGNVGVVDTVNSRYVWSGSNYPAMESVLTFDLVSGEVMSTVIITDALHDLAFDPATGLLSGPDEDCTSRYATFNATSGAVECMRGPTVQVAYGSFNAIDPAGRVAYVWDTGTGEMVGRVLEGGAEDSRVVFDMPLVGWTWTSAVESAPEKTTQGDPGTGGGDASDDPADPTVVYIGGTSPPDFLPATLFGPDDPRDVYAFDLEAVGTNGEFDLIVDVGPGLDLVATLLDEAGNVLDTSDENGLGGAEVVSADGLAPGRYRVIIAPATVPKVDPPVGIEGPTGTTTLGIEAFSNYGVRPKCHPHC